MIIRILLLALLCSGLLSAVERKELPKDTPFSDENTGIVFPPELGNFEKTEIRISSNPVVGTQIRYDGIQAGCSAGIYIYALDEKPRVIPPEEFMQHYLKARQTVLDLETISEHVKESELAGQKEFADKNYPARWDTFSLRSDGEETFQSDLVMILCGDRIVKLRITVPDSQKEAKVDCNEFIRKFCRLFYRDQPVTFREVKTGKTQEKH